MEELPLTPELLRHAYAQGYFPMPHPETGELLWFSPDPRAIIPLDRFHTSRSLARTLKRVPFEISVNRAFAAVMVACGERPAKQATDDEEADPGGTWITPEFHAAYGALQQQGNAHSVEVWLDGRLVGGVYGVALGGAFFAESKFHRVTDASKVALYHLVKRLRERGFTLLEVQFLTSHLQTLGAVEVPRDEYLRRLARALRRRPTFVDPAPDASGGD